MKIRRLLVGCTHTCFVCRNFYTIDQSPIRTELFPAHLRWLIGLSYIIVKYWYRREGVNSPVYLNPPLLFWPRCLLESLASVSQAQPCPWSRGLFIAPLNFLQFTQLIYTCFFFFLAAGSFEVGTRGVTACTKLFWVFRVPERPQTQKSWSKWWQSVTYYCSTATSRTMAGPIQYGPILDHGLAALYLGLT